MTPRNSGKMVSSAAMPKNEMHKKRYLLNAAVLVAAMGYFVDIYDLLPFKKFGY